MGDQLAERRWDQEYATSERYDQEPPIPFVPTIIDTVEGHFSDQATGLYVGCGNGRNFIPLIDAGLQLDGLDISSVALEQITDRRPDQADRLIHKSFLDLPPQQYDYLVSVQVFQHGDSDTTEKMFEKSYDLIRPGGLFFLRVNSTSTEIKHRYTTTQMNPFGGQTIRYLEGPKKDMEVHFYSKQELENLADLLDFQIVQPMEEQRMQRADGSTWAQWETIWEKPHD